MNYRVLADQIGNLLSRISSPRILGKMTDFTSADQDAELDDTLGKLRNVVCGHMEAYAISRACDSVLDVISTVCPSYDSVPISAHLSSPLLGLILI